MNAYSEARQRAEIAFARTQSSAPHIDAQGKRDFVAEVLADKDQRLREARLAKEARARGSEPERQCSSGPNR
jgi:type III secretion system FlhB-like substrate exporter